MEETEKIKFLNKLKKEEEDLIIILQQSKEMAGNREKIMKALHEYNDIKDMTQVVLGQLANIHGTTVANLHDKYNLSNID